MEEIRNRDTARLARFSSNCVQDQDGLFAEFAADPSACGADQEGVEFHKPLNKGAFHSIYSNKYLGVCSCHIPSIPNGSKIIDR